MKWMVVHWLVAQTLRQTITALRRSFRPSRLPLVALPHSFGDSVRYRIKMHLRCTYYLYIYIYTYASFMEMLYHISPRSPDWYFLIFGNQPKLSLSARGTAQHLQEVSGLALHLLLNSHPSGHNSPHCASWLSKLIGNYGLTSGLMVDLPLSIYRVDAALNPPNKKSKNIKQNH